MRSLILFSGAALGLLACTSEEPPTGPAGSPNLARATTGAYTAVDLGTIGGTSSQAFGINAVGQVVGWSTTGGSGTHAFMWEKGVMTDIGAQLGDGQESQATAINAAGQVVGYFTVCAGCGDPEGPLIRHAFLWTKGTAIDLGTLGGIFSQATGINAAGQVVGYSALAGSERPRAFLWKNGVMTDLGILGESGHSLALGINPAGQVVGQVVTDRVGDQIAHAFLWEKGVMTALFPSGAALAINPAGQVAGFFSAQEVGTHAVLWDKGVITDLGLGGTFSEARAINPAGQIVGFSPTGAFLWADGVITDLATLGGVTGGGTGSDATGINPAGQVVGWSTTAAGETHATLWTRK